MWRPVGQEHLAHDEVAAVARGVREERHRLQETVGARAVRLARRAAVEVPQREPVERGLGVEIDDLRFAAQIRNGLVAVQPDVLELALHSGSSFGLGPQKKAQDSASPEASLPRRAPSAASTWAQPSATNGRRLARP